MFLAGIEAIQTQYLTWYDQLSHVTIRGVEPIVRKVTGEGRAAASFSGGVDSHFTLAKCHDQIDDLFYLHGFDEGIVDPSIRQEVSTTLKVFGELHDKRVIEFDTNAREFWYASDLRSIGGAPLIISAAQSMASQLRTFYVPASSGPEHATRNTWSSEAIPQWSTETLAFVEHGVEAGRLDKVRELSKSDLVLEHLHVCWGDHGTAYNCGICEKCLRTIINLTACRALDRCSSLRGKLDLKRIANMHLRSPIHLDMAKENLRVIEDDPEFADLAAALRKAVNRPEWMLRLSEFYWAVKKSLGLAE